MPRTVKSRISKTRTARRPRAKIQRRLPPKVAAEAAGWVLRCAPGLAKLLIQELRFRKATEKNDRVAVLRQRNHDLLFLQRVKDPAGLHSLRIAEEAHRCLAYGRYKISDRQLDRLAGQLGGTARKLIVTADGSHFDRRDIGRWLSRRLSDRGVRLSDKASRLLWLFCIDQAYYLCEPAIPHGASTRPTRAAEREGALPPTIAAAMAFAAKPAPGETLLDPVCGSGTLLAEAAQIQPDCRLHGTDIDRKAIQAARANLADLENVSLVVGDGIATGLPAGSVDAVLANLPFGKLYGDRASNPELYSGLLDEIGRVGRPGVWRAVLLTSDRDALEAALEPRRDFDHAQLFSVRVRGEQAQAVLVQPIRPRSVGKS